jgi:hypothetical protein
VDLTRGHDLEAILSQTSDGMVGYWREMADDALALADEMTDAESKRSMLEIAAGCSGAAVGLGPAGQMGRTRCNRDAGPGRRAHLVPQVPPSPLHLQCSARKEAPGDSVGG